MRLAFACAVALAAVAVPSAGARPLQAAPPRVCEGLTICAPVGGPWVVVPPPGRGSTTAMSVWQLKCPPSLGIVGGVDVSVSNPWIDVSFPGRIGSPINPGITTGNSVVFDAVSFGPAGRAASFLPQIGCIPSEGGQRVPTGIAAPTEFRPGAGLVRHVHTIELRPRSAVVRKVLACGAAERLVSVQMGIGIFTARAPRPAQLRSVTVSRSIRGGKIYVTAARHGLRSDIAAQVQIHALCAVPVG